MIYQHEIPKGARLYFGKSAKLKREIEQKASEILYKSGFEEIVTPLFSYHQHEYIEDESELIRVNDQKNRKLTLRADSTIDVVRLITKRLGRSTEHNRWFYIQPVFRYPTYEYFQIGAEILQEQDSAEAMRIVIAILQACNVRPRLQISNIAIPQILAQNYGISLDILKSSDMDRLLETEHSWMEKLIYISKPEDIDKILGLVPEVIEKELLKIKELVSSILYDNVIIAPLYYANMRYYKDLFFRFFEGNNTVAMGGDYVSGDLEASGFALYTDNIIEILEKR
ncbi:ATP phosphoribosyltransferase regulatory subunit [Nitratiruptor tergarcus]|uniref:Histidine--tRNA ligase n=1 Tax=Nitratiruptor tergarcus DSM 16512 TaxID=1069081 RepID=A0A1W1WQ99_9BACT|nr:ATP phosphoribosyltransferase regulatory subunit [Nitratiruptor tergarcus]SMC08467.1 Histidyl-tRNA synthetase [Nitratiruptor tergarcus DSM 16512]